MRALHPVDRRARPTCLEALARAALAAAALLGSGCALASKGEALTPRYFSPALPSEPLAPAAIAGSPADAAPAPLDLRIGRIEPAAHLEERIAYRVSDSELAYYDDRRWTEPPEQFLRRALERELFETRAFRRVISGAAPTLDVELLGFEEVRQGAPRARLSLLLTLRDERRALLERTLSLEAPLELGPGADEGRALARAMADVLGRAPREVAERVTAELRRQPASSIAEQQGVAPSDAPAE
jgi:cholesterol transport system auxiliary component